MPAGLERPKTRYAKTALGRIAYQIVSDGPLDVLVVGPIQVPVDELWQEPRLVRCLDRLSGFCRHIWFNARGRGGSDPMPEAEGRFFESVNDDMVALVDALGLERLAIVDLGSSGWAGLNFAASHPERTSALVLRHPSACIRRQPDYPFGWSDARIATYLHGVEETWGTEEGAKSIAGSASGDVRFIEWLARSERASCSPAAAAWRFRSMMEGDNRPVLPTVTVPTLVITPSDGRSMGLMSHYVAEHLPRAHEVEVADEFLWFTGDPTPMFDAIEEFLTGKLASPELDRALATVLFTDVCQSTEHAARLGDRRWREMLDAHYQLARHEIERHRGRLIKTTGDGVLATFDGPGRAIRAGCAISERVSSLGIEVRAGLHTGEIELLGDDIGGIAVHIGQRVCACARPSEVLVSRTVADLVAGSGLQFQDRGEHELKGVPGIWKLFAVAARNDK